jgi:hypothetical protein
LLEPDLDNPLEIQASLKYCCVFFFSSSIVSTQLLILSFFFFFIDDDDGTYALAVANAVTEHASKTRKEWQHELCDEGN